MALADITTTTGNTYVYNNSLPGRVIRADLTNGNVQQPKLLETAHTAGSSKKSSKSLVKLSDTVVDADGLNRNVSVHMVITRDMSSAVTDTIVNNMVAEMGDLLADSSFLASFTKGGHY